MGAIPLEDIWIVARFPRVFRSRVERGCTSLVVDTEPMVFLGGREFRDREAGLSKAAKLALSLMI